MDLKKIISELRSQKEQIDQAIVALERLTIARKGRGRPPKWLSAGEERAESHKAAAGI